MSALLKTLQIVQSAYSGGLLLAELERLMPEIERELGRVAELETVGTRVRNCLTELDSMGETARTPYESQGPTRAHMRHSHYAAAAAMLRKAMAVPDQSGEE